LSEAPNEEMAQADKSMIELSERRHLSQVPQNFSPFLSGLVTFSDATKRKAGHTVPNAEAPKAPKALRKERSEKTNGSPREGTTSYIFGCIPR